MNELKKSRQLALTGIEWREYSKIFILEAGINNPKFRMRKPFITILLFFVVLYSSPYSLSSNLEFSKKILSLIPKEAKNNGKLGVVVKSINSDESFLRIQSG